MASQSTKGPWPIPVAGLGGLPSTKVDAPISSVFLVLFVLGAVTHMTILQVNMRRGKKFILSGLLFGFCMARITALTLRLVWTTHPKNVSVAIAANVLMAAGVLLLFIVNLIFTQRVIRATHPHLGWTKWFSLLFKAYYATIVIILIAVITGTVQSFYTLNPNIRRIDRQIQLVGATYLTVSAFLPIPLLLASVILPKKTRVEKFGEGRFRTKIYILLFTSTILTFGAAFRAGISYVPRPVAHPAWYHSKAVFYCINFLIEITVVALYAVARVDKRFHIPNGAKGPGDYTVKANETKREGEGRTSLTDRIGDEEDFFGDEQGGEKTFPTNDMESASTPAESKLSR